ncbi:hypothetical protein BT69DRAFT_1352979 [Atractiella rhizophila]|nr:hypothetical protein BT69DRAFT_1352979 [Atractiella rhizophila]
MSYNSVPENDPEQMDEPIVSSSRVASAIEARVSSQQAGQKKLPASKEHETKLGFYRLIDAEIRDKNEKNRALSSLETINKLIGNILDHPQEEKYRRFKVTNNLIKTNIVDVPGAYSYMVHAGFRKEVKEFVEYLAFPQTPTTNQLSTLRLAHDCLQVKLSILRASAERAEKSKQSEKEIEEARKQQALLAFQEDRRLKEEKDEREKVIREAAEKEKAEKGEESKSNQSQRKSKVASLQGAETFHYPVAGGGCG